MHDEVDLAPVLFQPGKNRIDRLEIGHVTVPGHEGAKFLRQRLDALLQCVALPGECDFRACVCASLGNAPSDGTIIGDTHDEAAFASHKTGCLSHFVLPNTFDRSCLWHRLQSCSRLPKIINC
ncbi:hypothetical protein D3C86_1556740 [compost metagenome]